MRIISIEGNIGSGKSTFLKLLKENVKDVYFLDEPVEQWDTIKDECGKTILENYYSDPKKYSFSFQMMAYISRLSLLRQAIKSNKYNIIITERCLYTDKNVFCKMLYDDTMISVMDYTIYNKWFEEFTGLMDNIYYIYLKTDPQIAEKRILHRNRKGETIKLEYLIRCNDYHDNWLNNTKNVTTIDANEKEINMKPWLNIVKKLMSE